MLNSVLFRSSSGHLVHHDRDLELMPKRYRLEQQHQLEVITQHHSKNKKYNNFFSLELIFTKHKNIYYNRNSHNVHFQNVIVFFFFVFFFFKVVLFTMKSLANPSANFEPRLLISVYRSRRSVRNSPSRPHRREATPITVNYLHRHNNRRTFFSYWLGQQQQRQLSLMLVLAASSCVTPKMILNLGTFIFWALTR
jgi:hypothetical protein